MPMRHYINLVEAVVRRAPFILQPELNPENYVITGSLRDYQNWRAIQYEGYTEREALAGQKRNVKEKTNYSYPIKGQMGEVGYVMISKIDNTIIPISRADEHHRGYDVLHDICKNISANPRNYIPVWCGGRNYIYHKEEIADWLAVIPKFLSYGGIDGVMIGANDLNNVFMKMSDFVKLKGEVNIKPGELSIMGKELIERYRRVANLLGVARADPFSKSKANAAFKEALELIEFLPVSDVLDYQDYDEIKKQASQIMALRAENNISGLEQLLFSHNSLKNVLHMRLKQTQKSDWKYRDYLRVFGDIPLAIDMLGHF